MSKNTALHMSSANGHLEIVKLLLAHIDRLKLDLQNDSGNTALHYASLNGKKDIVELLLKEKANAKLKNNYERTPIEDALQAGHAEIAELLAPVSLLEEEKMYSSFNPK